MAEEDQPLPTTGTALTLNDWLRRQRGVGAVDITAGDYRSKADQLVAEDNVEDAIHYYTLAIGLSPKDSTLYENRSLCYERLKKFDESLSDAQKAIELSDQSVANEDKKPSVDRDEGMGGKYRNKLMYWRKGRALRALKRFQESIDALVVSKSLAIDCQFIEDEIKDIKVEVICDLGYDRSEVEVVCDRYDSIDAIVKQLVDNKRLMSETSAGAEAEDHLPSNPFKYKGLYVNGLAKDVDERQLTELLTASCGPIVRCKVHSNERQSRAVMAFYEHRSVPEAIRVIRKNKELIRDQSVENLVFRYRHTCSDGEDIRSDPQKHFKGAVIGGECYKWRTTGCEAEGCDGLHIPLSHHLDQQSIETESVKRKRPAIVSMASPNVDEHQSVDDRAINGLTATCSTPCAPKRTRNVIVFDIVDDIDVSPIGTECSSDRKSIRLKTNSADSGVTPSGHRKRIVFDIKPDYDLPNEECFTRLKAPTPSTTATEETTANDRSVTSYDDLF